MEPERLKFIKGIKELLLSPEYQKNVPVFYGNKSTKNNEKGKGYNEYICKTILGRFGSISSRRRIFIINPFAVLVYRIYILCIFNNYMSKIPELKILLEKLLKLDTFNGFPNLTYLPHGIRFCIVKDINGVEKVITSQEVNYSSCNSVSGCSLIMSAEIRKENLPLDVDISELYNILKDDYQLSNYYISSKNKSEYDNRITLKNNYFEGICILLLLLNNLNKITNKKTNNFQNQYNYLKLTITQIEDLYTNVKENLSRLLNDINTTSVTLNQSIKRLEYLKKIISESVNLKNINRIFITSNNTRILEQQNNKLEKQSLINEIIKLFNEITLLENLYSIVKYKNLSIGEIIQEIITSLQTDKKYSEFLSFLETKPNERSTILEILQNTQRLQNAQRLQNVLPLQNTNNYFEGICILLLKLNQFKNTLNQLNNLMNRNRRLIESNNRVFKQQQNARQQIISNKLNEILSLIPKNQQLQQLYNYVNSKLNQTNVNLLEVSTQLIQEITTLLKSNETFLSFLETKPNERSTILEILQQN